MLFGKKYVENGNTLNEYAFSVPAPEKYFIHIIVERLEQDTNRHQILFFEKEGKQHVVYDKVEVGETLEQAFQRVFNKGYGFKDFKTAKIEGLISYAKNKEGKELPRFILSVRVAPTEQANETFEGYKLVWVTVPSSYEILKELTQFKTPGTAFNPTEKNDLPQDISKFGGLPYMPKGSEWPKCKLCDKAMYLICQFSKEDFPSIKMPDSEITHLLVFSCLNEQDFMSAMQVETIWVTKNQEVISEIPQLEHPEKRYQNPPKECKANPMELLDCVPYTSYKHPELLNLYNQLPKERAEYYDKNYRPFEGTKLNGEPSFVQGEEFPVCDVCGKKMEFWGQLSSEEPVTRLLKKDFSDHGLMWGDVGTIYLYYCKDWCTKIIKSVMQCY